jgi:hypothetical protein
MISIIRKDLREQRAIPWICAALIVAPTFYFMLAGKTAMASLGGILINLTAGLAEVLPALLAANFAFSAESANRTITFLTALPLSRSTIWRAKVIAGLITVGVSIAYVWVFRVLSAVMWWYLGSAGTPTESFAKNLNETIQYANANVLGNVMTLIFVYTIALIVAPLTENAIIGAVASAVGCAGVAAAGVMLGAIFDPPLREYVTGGFLLIMTVIALPLSHFLFTRGYTYRPSERLMEEVRNLLSWVVAGLIAVLAGFKLLHHGL